MVSRYPFDITLPDQGDTTSIATIWPGTINQLLPSNYLDRRQRIQYRHALSGVGLHGQRWRDHRRTAGDRVPHLARSP